PDFVAGTDPLVLSEELQDSEEFAIRHDIAFDGVIDTRAEHLPEIGARHPARWDVVAVGFGAELRVERKGDSRDVNEVVEWIEPVFHPCPIAVHPHETLQSDVADAGGHAARLHRHS